MLFLRFIILSLSFLLISCGIFDVDGSNSGTDNETDSGISKPWDGTTVVEPRYDNTSRTYYITDATHFAWIMKRTNDNTSIVYDNDTITLVNSIDMDNKTIQGIRIFKGTLDGDNKTIFNIQISRVAVAEVGLIGKLLDNGTVQNLTIRNGAIVGKSSVGGVVGRAINSKLVNVRNINVSVTGKGDSVGGVIGSTDNATVELVTSSSKVIGDNGVGGIIGYAKAGSITKSANSGSLQGKQSIGGIIGRSISSSVSLSHNNGQVLDGMFIGGIFGSSESGTIDNSSNIAKLRGRGSIGGIVGYVSKDVNITHVYNYGELYHPSSSTQSVGRIVGKEEGFTGSYSKDNNSYLEDNNLESVGEPKSDDAGFEMDVQQFKDKSNFISWDFDNTWKIYNKYPMLRWILTMDEKESL